MFSQVLLSFFLRFISVENEQKPSDNPNIPVRSQSESVAFNFDENFESNPNFFDYDEEDENLSQSTQLNPFSRPSGDDTSRAESLHSLGMTGCPSCFYGLSDWFRLKMLQIKNRAAKMKKNRRPSNARSVQWQNSDEKDSFEFDENFTQVIENL
ncbi:hypothetical protein M153_7100003588 [Pseudoloma neurophilia]|uniref:Uncharacterized protein n=1 Tax=Pseudoloma neurophilia TaxID=146866 RepID=A0A0R0M5D9_9MICR|nr:hypothetical protein M153_7100003588 [Pseudoloma neurophilia]